MKRRNSTPRNKRLFGSWPDDGQHGPYTATRVCLRCRKKSGSDTICQDCGGKLFTIGPMFKAPKRSSRRGKRLWAKLTKIIARRNQYQALRDYKRLGR